MIDPITGQKMRSWCGMIQPERLLEVCFIDLYIVGFPQHDYVIEKWLGNGTIEELEFVNPAYRIDNLRQLLTAGSITIHGWWPQGSSCHSIS